MAGRRILGAGLLGAWLSAAMAAPVIEDLSPSYSGLVARGASLFQANCLTCHGAAGDGQGPIAANLPVPPRDFTDQAWMARHADGGFFVAVQRGVPGTPMPPFQGRLSEADTWAVVAYLRSLSPRKRLDPLPHSRAHGGVDQPLGRRVFGAHCSGCHGADGKGQTPAARFFPRRPRDLTQRRWMAARSDRQLRGIIRYGVPGSPMPAFVDTLSDRATTALIGHLRRLSGTIPQLPQKPPLGRLVYRHHCALCHGLRGDGDGPNANQVEPRPRSFANPSWMAAQSRETLETAVRNGRRGSAMPPFRALLSDEEIAAVVEYIQGFATGIPGAPQR